MLLSLVRCSTKRQWAISSTGIRLLSISSPFLSTGSSNSDFLMNLSGSTRSSKHNNLHNNDRTPINKYKSNHGPKKVHSNYQLETKIQPKKMHQSTKFKKFSIKWTTGSERAQKAANEVFQKILGLSPNGVIKALNLETNEIETSSIFQFAKGIDLDRHGFIIANVERTTDHKKIPLVKLIEARVALRRYSDKVADRKQKELIDLGVIKSSKKYDNEKEKVGIKHIRVSWKIKETDLAKQKTNEIQSALKKGHKLCIYLDDKTRTNTDWVDDFTIPAENSNKKISKREKLNRTAILDAVKSLLEEEDTFLSFEGNIENRMLIKSTPKTLSTSKNKEALDEKKVLKEQKKQERREKLRLRTEKKQDTVT
ncbi:hypothetical protein Kpol_448p16 [Vanderwaltozyma polyspora DSM 70294]|uniref:Altered inheritance of mitochondria protein 23, mitochondrial n=1 Tax=Vanderwaltozyma polyspora (strain ATCC 22028 / DSM 70294 / BCRC 21397 / CBS 2163 / NBRC 10782 / NRRL Y-8283 / UCD 57-17) TaxID=436907 RepID=AIM23_VANPO|nr:uncharacterized protein Kpol_448p16 [Vanderwaltozyma polyspora DSM 70294]A7TQZ1.1 RecName: Full=Altered inheritance of mitochondria protein 23, mitochondrial; Flags: Precursor [Vanderwaltozyma polyspora DSM 70294]EDO15328.1 hypothetical protein Kpol_448p16 [Vanderwaltozyma polyspora DSM 70294]